MTNYTQTFFEMFMANGHVCDHVADDKFGPLLKCHNAPLDFTLRFEHVVFGFGLNGLFLLSFILRLFTLRNVPYKILPNKYHIIKLTFGGILLLAHLSTLISACLALHVTKYLVAAQALQITCALLVVILIIYEHRRTVKPSSVLVLYLLSTLIINVVELRSLLLRGREISIAMLLFASIGCKVVLLVLEHLSRIYSEKIKHEYSPEELSGVLGRSVFWFMVPLLRLGNDKVLSMDDLYPLNQKFHSDNLELKMEKDWNNYKLHNTRPFLYSLLSFLKPQFLTAVIPSLIAAAFKFSEPFLVQAIILYIETPANKREHNQPYILIFTTAFIFFGSGIAQAHFEHHQYQIMVATRGGVSSLIYSNALSASATQHDLAPLTLMSTDIERLSDGVMAGYQVWIKLLELFISICLLWQQLGPVSVAPTLVVFIFGFLQTTVSKGMGPLQAQWVAAVQRRVGVASTIVRSMKSVKLAGLVESMESLLGSEREREIALAKVFRFFLVGVNMIANFPSIFSGLIVFAGYMIESSIRQTPSLTTSKAFTSLAILTLMTRPAGLLLTVIPRVSAALGCAERIQKFLLADSYDDRRLASDRSVENGTAQTLLDGGTDPSVILSVKDLIVKERNDNLDSLRPISFSAKKGTLTIITGPVGCGKSTLLRCLLGEIIPAFGTISISTTYVGYCGQTPWLQNSTIRDNITGANQYDETWYNKIIAVCALERDFSRMPLKDLTEVGSRGLKLSGGQKQRITLARALYARCTILILDDFLSGLDEGTRHTITHQLFSTEGHIKRHKCTVILATHATKHMSSANCLLVLDRNGGAEYCGPPRAWKDFEEYAKAHDEKHDTATSSSGANYDSSKNGITVTQILVQENKDQSKRQTGDIKDWKYYSDSVGPLQLAIAAVAIILTCIGLEFQKLWLKWATENDMSLGRFLGLYALAMTITAVTMAVCFGYMLLVIAPMSAINLHKVLTKSVLHAPMSYFEGIDSSLLINRFSQDMAIIDLQLPMTVFQFVIALTASLISIALICIGSSYMSASIPFTLIALWFIQDFYLRTSRQLRILQLESRSPVYKHFTETLEGILTIRAFGWQEHFNSMSLSRLDDSQRPFYQLFCLQRWLSVVLSLMVSALGVLMVSLAVRFPSSSTSGNIGVALTSVLTFHSQLAQLLENWTQAEQNVGAVTRTREFEQDTPSEDARSQREIDPRDDWPLQGQLIVSNLSMTYSDGTKALNDISFSLQSGQKIGIAGRTGSGKSTLLSCLLRLIDPTEGNIVIDGKAIASVPRNVLRQRLICLPQDALLFANTFRFNLNPQDLYLPDDSLIDALKLVNLWNLVESRGGLDAEMTPDSLSAGEQQILAIARAVVRKRAAGGKSMLVLDEATSNVDSGTQNVIQKVIEQEFGGHTVLCVAHRVETIMDYDVVIVLEAGKVKKIGKPVDVL